MADPTDEAAPEMADEVINDDEQDVEGLPTYGTGAYPEPGMNLGDHDLEDEIRNSTDTSPELTGGDVDAAWEQAAMVGDEAVGGTVATPDQDIVDELGTAVGLEMDDRAFLRTSEILEERDDRRWELDPKASEDYEERHSDD